MRTKSKAFLPRGHEAVREALAQHPFTAGLSEDHLHSLAGCARVIRSAPGDYLWKQGQALEVVFLICAGRVALEIQIPNQGSLEIDCFEGGDFVPCLWLGSRYRRIFDARAKGPVEAIELDGKMLRELCDGDHELGCRILQRLAQASEHRLESARLMIMELQGHTPPKRAER